MCKQSHTPALVEGGLMEFPLAFLMCYNISKRFYLYYGLWRYWRPVTSPKMAAMEYIHF